MASESDFKIGAYAGGVGGMLYVEDITDTGMEGGVHPLVEWKNGAAAVVTGLGTKKWLGLPTHVWRCGVLTAAQRASLRAYCPTGSAQVYIRSLKPDSTYANFLAVMTWPLEEPAIEGPLDALLTQDVSIEMSYLVEQV